MRKNTFIPRVAAILMVVPLSLSLSACSDELNMIDLGNVSEIDPAQITSIVNSIAGEGGENLPNLDCGDIPLTLASNVEVGCTLTEKYTGKTVGLKLSLTQVKGTTYKADVQLDLG